MALTLNQLLAEAVLELTLVTPSSPQTLRRSVRWVAPTELVDPTPFLRGAELVLTTGAAIGADDHEGWRSFAERLKAAGTTAIGFGWG